MAVDIKTIVDVSITTQVTSPTATNFGVPMIFGFHNKFVERAKVISTITELEGLGFDSDDPEHKIASAILSQETSPSSIVLGRSVLAPLYTLRLTSTVQNSTTYKVAVDGADAQYTSDSSATSAEIGAGLKAAIDYLGKSVKGTTSVVSGATVLDLVPRAAVVSGAAQTFAFTDGDTLLLSVDGAANQTATFNTADFVSIGAATAAEVVTVLTADWTGVTASAVTDPDTGSIKIRVEHNTAGYYGPNRTIKITDGTGTPNADSLKFPTTLVETQSAFLFQNKTRRLALSGGTSLLMVNDTTADPGDLGADITAIKNENDSWYAVIPVMGSKSIIANGSSDLITAIAASGTDKVLFFDTADHDVVTNVAGNVAATLFAANQTRAVSTWNSAPLSAPSAAWVGLQLPKDPGSTTWNFKTLTGITADDFTAAEIAALDANNVNRYVSIAGISIMQPGVTEKSQFFIDIRQFIDFLKSRMQEAVYGRLASVEKVPFTDAGIAIIENEVRAILQLGVRVGGLAADPAPTVTVPLASAVSTSNKSNRILPDIKFTATLAGAIHKVVINGIVSV